MGKASTKAKQAVPSNDRVILDQLVTPEARRKGDYRIDVLSVTEGDFGPEEKGDRSVVRNRAVDVVGGWVEKGLLDDRQMFAVLRYRRTHGLVFGMPARVTANWAAFISGRGGSGSIEAMVANKIEAKQDLEYLDTAYFKKWPPYVESTWLNAVIHNLGAGPSGNLLGHETERAARAGTLTIVRLVADTLAMEWGV